MTIPVLIEPLEGARFRATGGEPFAVSAESSSRDGALARLRELIEARMAAGAEIVSLELVTPDNPWADLAGWLEDSPLLGEWQEAMADYRRAIDLDDSIP